MQRRFGPSPVVDVFCFGACRVETGRKQALMYGPPVFFSHVKIGLVNVTHRQFRNLNRVGPGCHTVRRREVKALCCRFRRKGDRRRRVHAGPSGKLIQRIIQPACRPRGNRHAVLCSDVAVVAHAAAFNRVRCASGQVSDDNGSNSNHRHNTSLNVGFSNN